MAKLSPAKRAEIISELTVEEAESLLYDWTLWGRPEQVTPQGDWFVWLIRSGRGWGKTRTGSEFVRESAAKGFKHIALIGQTKADVRDTMIEIGESSLS